MNKEPLLRSQSNTEPDTRQRIIEAALTEFSEHGLAGARVDRIAESAGANKAMIYYHFGSKRNLYMETARIGIQDVIRGLAHSIYSEVDLESALKALARRHTEMNLKNPRLRSILLRELANPESEILDVFADEVLTSEVPLRVRDRLREAFRDGLVDFDDVRQMQATLLSMTMGFFALAPMFRRILHLEDEEEFRQFAADRIDVVVDVFLNGIRVRS
jgi:AcrR family transcriptional regulator